MRFLPLFVALSMCAAPAHAAPLAGLVGLVSGAFTAMSGSVIGSFLLRTAASFALNALANALIGKPKTENPGIRTEATAAGGTLPQTVVFGRYATGGTAVCPPMTHGRGGKKVDYLTYVIDLADFPIHSLDAVFVDSEKCVFTTPGNSYGETASDNTYTKRAWLRWHDGTQTAADPMLVDVYGKYERPWTVDHILTGVAYAVITFKYDDEETKGMPECLFEVQGARLYDLRRDSSVGGVGSQRWNDPATWEFTENPIVMIYNLLRGLTLADGSVYGLRVPASGLPIDRWAAAMNTCDELVGTHDGLEPRYRAGMEFSLDTEPLDVIQTLLTSCGGQIAECGGVWNILAGPAAIPRAHFTDDDLIRDKDREFRPFRGLADTYNGVHASYPAPFALWKPKDAPPYYSAEWQAADEGRLLIASLQLNAVTSGYQAQRLMIEMLADNRRMVMHTLALPPSALGLLPLDSVTWTSAENGYDHQLFEVVSKTVDPETLCVSVQLRERGASDYEYDYETVTQPLIIPKGPWNPADGAGGEPEDEYTGPDGELAVERPTAVDAHLVALHGTAVSETTNGGHTWRISEAPFQGGRDIEAIENMGFFVRTNDGKGWFAARNFASQWTALEFPDSTASNVLLNGGFEANSYAWTTALGSPRFLETRNPPQNGGRVYAHGTGAWRLEQALVVDATKELRMSADLWVQEGGVGRIGVRANGLEGNETNLSFGPAGTVVPQFSTIEAPFDAEHTLRLTLVATNGTVVCGPIGLLLQTGTGAQFRAEILDAGGAISQTPFALAFMDLDKNDRIEALGLSGYSLPEGSAVSVAQVLGGYSFTGTEGVGDEVIGTGNVGKVVAQAAGPFDFAFVASTGRGFALQPRPGAEAETTRYVDISPTPGWQTVNLPSHIAGSSTVVAFVEGLAGKVWIDNVSVNAGLPGAADVLAIGRDLSPTVRHFLAGTKTTLFSVKDGIVEEIVPAPIAPTCLAASDALLLVGGENSVAFSGNGGANFAIHPTSSRVAQVFASPMPLAVLDNGAVCAVDGSGVYEVVDLGGKHWIERAWATSGWLGVEDATGRVVGGPIPYSMVDAGAEDMPTGGTGGYSLVATDQGRKVGWRRSGRDLFNQDDGDPWTLSPPLTQTVFDMQEVR